MEPDAFSTLFRRLIARAKTDPELADVLRGLASLTLKELGPQSEIAPKARPKPPAALAPVPESDLASDADLSTFVEEFTDRPSAPPEPTHVKLGLITVPLQKVPGRMRLKARACRWLAEHGYTNDPVALNEHRDLIDEAAAEDCYLWMLSPKLVNPNRPQPFRMLADNFEATAQVLDLWLGTAEDGKKTDIAKLAAQAQAALREAVGRVRRNPDGSLFLDEDQRALFLELKHYSAEHHVYLHGLALDHIVDPDAVGERLAALDGLEATLGTEKNLEKARADGFKRLKYHVKKLQNKSSDPAYDWQVVANTVGTLRGVGVPESDNELRDTLAPVAGLLPLDTPHTLLVRIIGDLAELERAKRAKQAERAAQVTEDLAPEVARAANLIAGRTLVVIGGKPNPDAISQIETALRCEVDWISAKPHTSPERFKPNILQKDVILVLLLIRWSSHVFSEVDTLCQANQKYLVRVPRGYNVKSLATQILDQASERLATRK